ncbi:hypothetical protein LSI54_11645 [Nesterenkonia sp. AY15]|uniref:maltokinase N-terminal cap-like domain-containing protein n=1 Tax=Nesterenkonia sp. AY15 TaxID=2901139 RepID=UPI001F4C5D8A|nr:hypothetical protein [Nesterenkonia sp. AY15]MCH8572005.1 hypothetical protein [Nesterenkonia sp. AY15]
MVSFRGEEQSGFLDLVGTWLSQQSWFQAAPGRRVITRVGGLRLPASHGDPDQGLHLELHILTVDHSAGQARVAVPMALRTRPSALAGKTAFIGRLATPAGDLWVYDGARDRAFLAAWHEMARRQQGSRNGRSRGEAFAEFDTWPAFTAKLQRTPLDAPTPAVVRTAVTIEGEVGETGRTVVDFIRRPDPQRSAPLDTVLRMTRSGSRTMAGVLGVVTGSWPESNPTTGENRWVTGDLGIIREASIAAAPASALVRTALHDESDFLTEATRLGRSLGDFHADLAGNFGAYPQTSLQLEIMNGRAADALDQAWGQVREDFEESEATDLAEVVELLTRELRDAEQVMSLQKIHGALSVDRIRQADHDAGWIIDEDGGMVDHALPLRDVVSVLISLAELVMETSQEDARPAAAPADTAKLDLGLWYEQVTDAVLEGYRSSDAPRAGIESDAFRAAMLTEALELFHRSAARWVFQPSMLRPSRT